MANTGAPCDAPRRPRGQCAARAAVFRSWLVETFGHARLGRGSGVLDVGAGNGELSFQLRNLHGLPTTALDPRELSVDTFARKFRAGVYLRSHVGASAPDEGIRPECCDTVSCPLVVPRHIRMFMEGDLGVWPQATASEADASSQGGADEDGELAQAGHSELNGHADRVEASIKKAMQRARTWVWKAEEADNSGHEHDLLEPGTPIPNDNKPASLKDRCACERGTVFSEEEYREASISDAAEAREAMWGCSVVVGLYPDQAIDALVDFALSRVGQREHALTCVAAAFPTLKQHWGGVNAGRSLAPIYDGKYKSGKPFAALPCCVYAREFPHRRLPDGRPVTTYPELLEYLTAKAPRRIRVAELAFAGPKNKVLYISPDDHDDSAGAGAHAPGG